MKIKPGIILTKLGDDNIAVPTCDSFRGLIRMNDTAVEIWHGLEEGLDENQIAARLVKNFEGADMETALKSVYATVEKLKANGLLEPDKN